MIPSVSFNSSVRIGRPPARRGGFRRVADDRRIPPCAPDLQEAADLYYRKAAPRGLAYHHFETSGAAVAFARDHLSPSQISSSVLQVGEERFEGDAVAAMVRSLRKATAETYVA